MWGFTVDDALIPARYAANIARGAGYTFDVGVAATDGVTPLGFPFVLAPFAGGGPLAALAAAKVIGLVAWVLAAALLGVAVARAPGPRLRFSALALVGLSAPLAAWSVAGLETGVVTAIAAASVSLRCLGRPRAALALVAVAAALRPELLPYALALAVLPLEPRATLRCVAVALPFVAVALTRLALFGRVVPLSVLAKPASEELGFVYAAACFALTGPIVLVAPRALMRLSSDARAIAAATVVHFGAVAVAGGDWMPLSRLVVPVLPGVVLVAAHLAGVASAWSMIARTVVAAAGLVFQAWRAAPDARRVGEERRALIEEMRPSLAGAEVVATLDVGWVGAATDASIVDLAGLTDPSIAVLPGGHTSKRIPSGLLEARHVDAVVLLLLDGHDVASPWTDSYFGRAVELTVTEQTDPSAFVLVAVGARPHLRYVVARRAPGDGARGRRGSL
jgi:hypothetical protein